MNKVILVTGTIVGVVIWLSFLLPGIQAISMSNSAFLTEPWECIMVLFWMMACNAISPQILGQEIQKGVFCHIFMKHFVNIGMVLNVLWLLATGLSVSSPSYYRPTWSKLEYLSEQ